MNNIFKKLHIRSSITLIKNFTLPPEGHKECWICRYKLEEEVKPEDKDAKPEEVTVSEMSSVPFHTFSKWQK